MSTIKGMMENAKMHHKISQRIEKYWEHLRYVLSEEELDIIQMKLADDIYPARFRTAWEKELYDGLNALLASLYEADLIEDNNTGDFYQDIKDAYKILDASKKEQERREKASDKMRSYHSKQAEKP